MIKHVMRTLAKTKALPNLRPIVPIRQFSNGYNQEDYDEEYDYQYSGLDPNKKKVSFFITTRTLFPFLEP